MLFLLDFIDFDAEKVDDGVLAFYLLGEKSVLYGLFCAVGIRDGRRESGLLLLAVGLVK